MSQPCQVKTILPLKVLPKLWFSCILTQSGAKPLFWQNLERQDCFHLTLLRHQNIKTSLYTISKNSWVLPFLVNLTPVTMKLQLTVFLDHPVTRLMLLILLMN